MKSVYVHDLAYFLGDQNVSIKQSFQDGRLLTEAQQFIDAGFAFHRMSSANQTAYDLAVGAVSQIKHTLQDVSSIIYATCLPLNGNIGSFSKFKESRDVKFLMDYPASHLQADFGMENAAVLGLNQQACTSMLGSLRLARALILSEPDQKKILCVNFITESFTNLCNTKRQFLSCRALNI